MATSTCSKCGGHLFEIKVNEPHDARYKTMFVQCRACGVPIGAQDYYNLGSLLKEQEKRLKSLESQISRIEQAVDAIVRALRRR